LGPGWALLLLGSCCPWQPRRDVRTRMDTGGSQAEKPVEGGVSEHPGTSWEKSPELGRLTDLTVH